MLPWVWRRESVGIVESAMAVRRLRPASAGDGGNPLFQDSHVPLTGWFRAAWWVVSQQHAYSAKGLQRALDLESYKTA